MKNLLLLIAALLITAGTFAQSVGINSDGSTPNASAILDVSSTTKGFLPPRMTYVQKTAIESPVAGLIVWCNNCGTSGEVQVFNGTIWTNMIGGAALASVPVLAATTAASTITNATAASGGNVTSDGGATVTARGVCWSTTTGPTTAGSKTTDSGTTGSFTSAITGLADFTTYYVRAYATNNGGTTYGTEVSLTTLAVVPTLAATTTAASITTTSATSGGNVTYDGKATITARGVCWGIATAPTTANSKTTDDGTTGSFTSSITGLSPHILYYVRAYATNSIGTTYGAEVTFTTLGLAPTATTTAATSLSSTGGTINGTVNANYLSSVVTFEWGTTASYGTTVTPSQSPVTGSTGTSVSAAITGLTSGVTYHFRVIAENSLGITNGSDLTFTTNTLPTLAATTAASSIGNATATSGGNVTSDGGATITARGVCWSTTTGPTTGSSKTTDGGTTGSYSSSITGLTVNTLYYVRAYATNSVGTTYGTQVSFTTVFAIGQSYGGGIIAYIDGSGLHGLIAASSDQSATSRYASDAKHIGAKGIVIGTGNANTTTIVTVLGAGSYAAKLCYDLDLGGYSDWYLPSQDELSKLYALKVLGFGGFTDASYISSTEFDGAQYYDAWSVWFGTGDAGHSHMMDEAKYVRAIRSF
jgi:acyl-CoA-binding protein